MLGVESNHVSIRDPCSHNIDVQTLRSPGSYVVISEPVLLVATIAFWRTIHRWFHLSLTTDNHYFVFCILLWSKTYASSVVSKKLYIFLYIILKLPSAWQYFAIYFSMDEPETSWKEESWWIMMYVGVLYSFQSDTCFYSVAFTLGLCSNRQK